MAELETVDAQEEAVAAVEHAKEQARDLLGPPFISACSNTMLNSADLFFDCVACRSSLNQSK